LITVVGTTCRLSSRLLGISRTYIIS